MKALFAIAWSLLLIVHTHAEPVSKIDGMAGIPFGSTVDQVKAAMDERGAIFLTTKSTNAHLAYEKGKFNNEEVWFWHFYFTGGKLYKCSVAIDPPDSECIVAYESVKKLISDKYGKPYQETKTAMEADELTGLVRNGKIELETNWKDAKSSNRSIACRLLKRVGPGVIIRIIYQDDAVEEQIINKQRDDI